MVLYTQYDYVKTRAVLYSVKFIKHNQKLIT